MIQRSLLRDRDEVRNLRALGGSGEVMRVSAGYGRGATATTPIWPHPEGRRNSIDLPNCRDGTRHDRRAQDDHDDDRIRGDVGRRDLEQEFRDQVRRDVGDPEADHQPRDDDREPVAHQ
jgi:hypothetical protein